MFTIEFTDDQFRTLVQALDTAYDRNRALGKVEPVNSNRYFVNESVRVRDLTNHVLVTAYGHDGPIPEGNKT